MTARRTQKKASVGCLWPGHRNTQFFGLFEFYFLTSVFIAVPPLSLCTPPPPHWSLASSVRVSQIGPSTALLTAPYFAHPLLVPANSHLNMVFPITADVGPASSLMPSLLRLLPPSGAGSGTPGSTVHVSHALPKLSSWEAF